MRKPAFCISENKDADQLRSNCAADQRLCFRYIDSTTFPRRFCNPRNASTAMLYAADATLLAAILDGAEQR